MVNEGAYTASNVKRKHNANECLKGMLKGAGYYNKRDLCSFGVVSKFVNFNTYIRCPNQQMNFSDF